MSAEQEKEDACLEFDCAQYQLKGASMSHGPDGEFFRCRCGPLTQAEVAELEHASKTGKPVRLVFPESEVLLSHVELVPADDGFAAIGGRVVQSSRTTEKA